MAPSEPKVILGPGAFFGARDVTLGKTSQDCKGIAASETEILLVPAKTIGEVFRSDPSALKSLDMAFIVSKKDASKKEAGYRQEIENKIRAFHSI